MDHEREAVEAMAHEDSREAFEAQYAQYGYDIAWHKSGHFYICPKAHNAYRTFRHGWQAALAADPLRQKLGPAAVAALMEGGVMVDIAVGTAAIERAYESNPSNVSGYLFNAEECAKACAEAWGLNLSVTATAVLTREVNARHQPPPLEQFIKRWSEWMRRAQNSQNAFADHLQGQIYAVANMLNELEQLK